MRLELTRRGDYAVRAMLALARRATTVPTSAREIATEMAIPIGFVPRVMVDLVDAGLVASVTGRTGGYVLARPPGQTTLLAVIEAIEGDSRRTTCVLRGSPCGLDAHCQVHDVFFAAQDALLSRLGDVTLADLVASPERRNDRQVASPRRPPRRS
jgi:Rrf2 family protein